MNDALSNIEPSAATTAAPRLLEVSLSDDVSPPGPDHELLLGFHFGASELAVEHPSLVSPGLEAIGRGDLYECWWYAGEVSLTSVGDVRVAQCEDFAVAVLQLPDGGPEQFKQMTYDAYCQLLGVVRNADYGHLARIWNYFGDINAGDGDAEKYRQFSIGRADAFEEFGLFDEAVPTGTAIGTVRDAQLTIVALLSRRDFQSVENPRQVSAFRYPRQYGPRSPKFSRGGCVSLGELDVFLISGTAAIVGHESAHPHDTALQISETLTNLHQLCDTMSGLPVARARLMLDADCILRVYLRDRSDLQVVAAKLQELLGDIHSNVVFLHANICRRELMVEIDGTRII